MSRQAARLLPKEMSLTVTTFADLALSAPLQRAIRGENYSTPTPIQALAIPHLLAGRDLLGCAQTGTGKTAAFALPILERFDHERRPAVSLAPRALVLSPTRELAVQISESFATYGRHVHFRQCVVYGGVGQGPQTRALSKGVHLLVATPGRMLDLMGQGFLRLDKLEVFVLDEADRMLDMGFLPDLKRIIAQLPKQRQSLFFSATMPESIAKLANELLTDPVRVSITPPATTVELSEQRVMYVEKGNKKDLLYHVLTQPGSNRALVFTRTKHGADKVAKQLCQSGLSADAIHGNKSQPARQRALVRFRGGSLRVLVATDVAARGIDVDGISHVINYDMPHEPESYVHRIGRTGRAGATGIAVSFCESTERGSLRAIERLVKRSIEVDQDQPYHSSVQAAPAFADRKQPRRGASGGPPRPGKRPFAPKRAKAGARTGRPRRAY